MMFKNLFFVISLFVVLDLSARDSQFYNNNLLSDGACRQCSDVICNNSYNREYKEDISAFYNPDTEIDICFDINGRDLKIKKISLKGNRLYISFDDDFNIACKKEERSFFKTSCNAIFNIQYSVLKYSVKSLYSIVCFSLNHPIFISFCMCSLYNFLPGSFQKLVCAVLYKTLISTEWLLASVLKDVVKVSYRNRAFGVLSSVIQAYF